MKNFNYIWFKITVNNDINELIIGLKSSLKLDIYYLLNFTNV